MQLWRREGHEVPHLAGCSGHKQDNGARELTLPGGVSLDTPAWRLRFGELLATLAFLAASVT